MPSSFDPSTWLSDEGFERLPNPATRTGSRPNKIPSKYHITYNEALTSNHSGWELPLVVEADNINWGNYFIRMELAGELVVAIRCELIVKIKREAIKVKYTGLQPGGSESSFLNIE